MICSFVVTDDSSLKREKMILVSMFALLIVLICLGVLLCQKNEHAYWLSHPPLFLFYSGNAWLPAPQTLQIASFVEGMTHAMSKDDRVLKALLVCSVPNLPRWREVMEEFAPSCGSVAVFHGKSEKRNKALRCFYVCACFHVLFCLFIKLYRFLYVCLSLDDYLLGHGHRHKNRHRRTDRHGLS